MAGILFVTRTLLNALRIQILLIYWCDKNRTIVSVLIGWLCNLKGYNRRTLASRWAITCSSVGAITNNPVRFSR